MRFTIRLIGAIWLSAMVVIAAFTFLSVQTERTRLTDDLERRAWLLSEQLKEAVEPFIDQTPSRTERIVKRFASPGRGVAIYDRFAGLLVATPDLDSRLPVALPLVSAAITTGAPQKGFESLDGQETFCYAVPLLHNERAAGAFAICYDTAHIARRASEVVRYNAIRFLVLGAALSLTTLVVVTWSVTRPVKRLVEWTKELRSGKPVPPPGGAERTPFGPLAMQVSDLARGLARAQAAAEREALLRLRAETVWTEERLKQFVSLRLGNRPFFVVSNREPFIHVRRGRQIETVTPASGLVTALDPVMRACGGVWVAHGSGDADREVVDARGIIRVPQENPRYDLKRVWLTSEEEDGYYYGFANEGLWPLCHIVHARPTFRPENWVSYTRVNRKFAEATAEEMRRAPSPVVLVQDYHFALLPRLIKERRPDARVAIFWHIPWPNPEAFGICPWQSEILKGMLGADLIGFHTQFHCNNFLDTVDRSIEARIDWEHFSISRGHHTTYVKPFPISVTPQFVGVTPNVTRDALLAELGIHHPAILGVGVERIDYTKGLPERFEGIRRFFQRHPAYRERMTFVQLAAPSRSRIPRYRAVEDEVERIVQEINGQLRTRQWRPILLLKAHHNHRDIWPFYRWADFCMVTSLHDGMNLVAKEFVSVREDEGGVLILSRFTGAAYELRDAVLVNPYDVDAVAEAIRVALQMPVAERRSRMARMREVVLEHNIYRWAGLLLSDLVRLPASAAGVRVP